MHPPLSFTNCDTKISMLAATQSETNSLLSNCCIIPIKGVSPEKIFYLETQLQQKDGITEVLEHKQTLSKGWYSILTTATTF